MLNPATRGRRLRPAGAALRRSTKAGMLNPATPAPAVAAPAAAPARSTKAGMLNPATPARRLAAGSARCALNEGRDVKPGDTRNPPACPWRNCPLNEGRDVKPGDTRLSTSAKSSAPNSLNEGRDVKPGDTRQRDDARLPFRQRSTKAGMLNPATPMRPTAAAIGA